MEEDDFLKNEQLKMILSPHPLSFMNLQFLSIFLILWGAILGWLVGFSGYRHIFAENEWITIMVWGIVLLITGVIASLIAIRWRIFFLFLTIFLVGLAIVFWQNLYGSLGVFLPFYTIGVSIIGFLLVEWYRRSHQYIITNQRIIFKGGITSKEERTLRYSKISDINARQGILGQIFGFGTITPISESGFGLGSDSSFAAGGIGIGQKKVGLFGIFGGSKEVKTPRSRSYYELHGVYPYKEVKKLVETMVQENDITPYQQEQVTFQKEQLDIQKQMRDLLKKQSEIYQEEKNDEIE